MLRQHPWEEADPCQYTGNWWSPCVKWAACAAQTLLWCSVMCWCSANMSRTTWAANQGTGFSGDLRHLRDGQRQRQCRKLLHVNLKKPDTCWIYWAELCAPVMLNSGEHQERELALCFSSVLWDSDNLVGTVEDMCGTCSSGLAVSSSSCHLRLHEVVSFKDGTRSQGIFSPSSLKDNTVSSSKKRNRFCSGIWSCWSRTIQQEQSECGNKEQARSPPAFFSFIVFVSWE